MKLASFVIAFIISSVFGQIIKLNFFVSLIVSTIVFYAVYIGIQKMAE